MRKTMIVVSTLLIAFLSWNLSSGDEKGTKHPEVDFSISCAECHAEETPDAYNDWKSSKHGLMNYGCYLCHGDGEVEFYPSPGTEQCIGCHSAQDVDFEKLPLKNCYDCHKGHTLKFHE